MLRSRFSSSAISRAAASPSSSSFSRRGTAVVVSSFGFYPSASITVSSLYSSRRFCSSATPAAAAAAGMNDEPNSKQEASRKGDAKAEEEEDPTAVLMAKIMKLEAKTSAWTLTADDMKFTLETLRELSDAKRAGGHVDALSAGDVVPYVDPAEPSKGQHVPFAMSALYRALVNYQGWYTLSGNSDPTSGGDHVLELRRPHTPERDLYAAPFAAGSMPSGVTKTVADASSSAEQKGDAAEKKEGAAAETKAAEKRDGRLFLLGTSPDLIEPMAEELKKATGSASTPRVSGYELYQLAHMLCHQQADAVRFDGISIHGPSANNMTLIANEPASQRVIHTMSCDAMLEQALVLVKWLVEESPQMQLRGHKALFVMSSIKSVLINATYYVLSDNQGAAFVFSNMHALLRYRDYATSNAGAEWEQRGPWKVGTAEGKSLMWSSPDRPVIINPAAPGDMEATKFPAFNMSFSAAAIEQMKTIAGQQPQQQQQ